MSEFSSSPRWYLWSSGVLELWSFGVVWFEDGLEFSLCWVVWFGDQSLLGILAWGSIFILRAWVWFWRSIFILGMRFPVEEGLSPPPKKP